MELNSLTAVSPVDGRYRKNTQQLDEYFSEFALIRYRFKIEVEYFIALTEIIPQLSHFKDHILLRELRSKVENFEMADAKRVKEIENITNHDVKAVEIFLREIMADYPKEREFIHFGLTSFDVDGMARPLMLKEAHEKILMPSLSAVVHEIDRYADDTMDVPMMAFTHGQPASPTYLGKELLVFRCRLDDEIEYLKQVRHSAKFGGATGNFNAHHVAYPDIDWEEFATKFIENLGMKRNRLTTQIEPYDHFAAYCHALFRINTTLIDFCRDVWEYIKMEYFIQQPKSGEVGSSAMPHKINPIDFENAEGNLGFANAMFDHFAAKLPISRLQRDLSDSTVIRNAGMPLAHILIAHQAIIKGMKKLRVDGKPNVNFAVIAADLEKNWAVVAEAIQTILRREGYPSSYDTLKELTRTGKKITKETIHAFIDTLDVSMKVKLELKEISPSNYTGVRPY